MVDLASWPLHHLALPRCWDPAVCPGCAVSAPPAPPPPASVRQLGPALPVPPTLKQVGGGAAFT